MSLYIYYVYCIYVCMYKSMIPYTVYIYTVYIHINLVHVTYFCHICILYIIEMCVCVIRCSIYDMYIIYTQDACMLYMCTRMMHTYRCKHDIFKCISWKYYMHIFMYTHIYIYIYIYFFIYAHTCIYVYAHVSYVERDVYIYIRVPGDGVW